MENRALQLLPAGLLPTPADLILAHTLPFRGAGAISRIVSEFTGATALSSP